MKNIKTGLIVYLLYLSIYYLVPLFMGPYYNFSYMNIFVREVDHFKSFLGLFFFSFLFCVIYVKSQNIYVFCRFRRFDIFSFHKINFVLAIIFFFLSISFLVKHGVSYRHKGEPVSKVSSHLVPLMILRLYFNAYALRALYLIANKIKMLKLERFVLAMSSAGMTLSSSSSFALMSSMILILISLEAYGIGRLVTYELDSLVTRLRSTIILFAITLSGFLMGVANKLGLSRAIDSIVDLSFFNFMILPLRRLSYHYYSFAYHLEHNLNNLDFQLKGIFSALEMFTSRLHFLYGLEMDKSEVWSPSRLNIISILEYSNHRTGASPGLLSSFNFFPFFPLNLVLWILALCMILNIFNVLFNNDTRLKMVSYIFILLYLQAILDNSLEFLNPVSNAGISFVFLILLRLSVSREGAFDEIGC